MDDLNARLVRAHTSEAHVHDDLLGLGAVSSVRMFTCSNCSFNVGPLQGFPVKLHAPTIRPCLCVTATLTFTPNP